MSLPWSETANRPTSGEGQGVRISLRADSAVSPCYAVARGFIEIVMPNRINAKAQRSFSLRPRITASRGGQRQANT
jgi:hypothetical protein